VFKKIAMDEILNNLNMMMEFATLSRDAFRAGVAVIQHFCARIDKKQMNSINDVLEKGLYVLYDYVFYYCIGYNEETICSSIETQLPGDVQLLTIEEAFKSSKPQFESMAKQRYRPVDHGGKVFLVNKAEDNPVAEKVTAIVKPSGSITPGINVGFISTTGMNLHNPSFSSNTRSVDTGMSQISRGANFTAKLKTLPLSEEKQKKIFPKFIPPTDAAETYLYLFKRKHGDDVPMPQIIIKVPWTQGLSIIASHECLHMEDGFMFLNYLQISDWMRDKWHHRINQLRRWDEENVSWPWLDGEYFKFKDVIPVNIDMAQREFVDFLKAFNYRTFLAPLKHTMQTGLVFSLLKKDDELEIPLQCDVEIVSTIYRSIFETGKKLEAVLHKRLLVARRASTEARSIDDIPHENEIFYHPLEENTTGDLYKDYGRIMPPCIKTMYETHVQNRTHFKHDERLKFFWWAFKASISLDVVMTMWSSMVDNDSSIAERDKELIKREGKNLFIKHQRNREAGNEYNFFGCGKMAAYCPFAKQQTVGDIEDITVDLRTRKIRCGGSLWEKKTPIPSKGLGIKKWPDKHLKIWSPMTATGILSNYYSNKI
jgi:hypothetical protein